MVSHFHEYAMTFRQQMKVDEADIDSIIEGFLLTNITEWTRIRGVKPFQQQVAIL